MALQSLVGDWNQTRTRPSACVDSEHVTLLEAAFPGGAFHPALYSSSPIYREALRTILQVSEEAEPFWWEDSLSAAASFFEEEDPPVPIMRKNMEVTVEPEVPIVPLDGAN
eukprot:6204030-Heterocapsa_arctica.AAC.1